MIKAKIYKDEYENTIKYMISGHAGFADEGYDIVCAAVSVLAQTALFSLNKVCEIDDNEMKYFIDDNGVMEVSLSSKLPYDKRKKANIVLRTMELGLESVAESYPRNVAVEYREV